MLTLKFSGSIEENADYESMVGPIPPKICVNTKAVTRINSVGVRGWIKYFQSLQAKTKIVFVDCSVAIVEQINLISNFTCGGQVESLYVPYLCQNCGAESAASFSVENIKSLNFEIPDGTCPKCGGKAILDDVPEEYFSFLMTG